MNHNRLIPTLRWTLSLALLVPALLPGCGNGDPVSPSPAEPLEWSFDFEEGMEGWYAMATDTLNPPIDWRVQRSTERSLSGEGAIELHLENLNDAGKIWMERAFELEPGVLYQVEVSYGFATADWGDVNLFTIIAGVHLDPPRHADDLTYKGETGHGEEQDVGYVWMEKAYDFSVTGPAEGTAYVTIGVWGTWETTRTYFVDDVTVRFTPTEA